MERMHAELSGLIAKKKTMSLKKALIIGLPLMVLFSCGHKGNQNQTSSTDAQSASSNEEKFLPQDASGNVISQGDAKALLTSDFSTMFCGSGGGGSGGGSEPPQNPNPQVAQADFLNGLDNITPEIIDAIKLIVDKNIDLKCTDKAYRLPRIRDKHQGDEKKNPLAGAGGNQPAPPTNPGPIDPATLVPSKRSVAEWANREVEHLKHLISVIDKNGGSTYRQEFVDIQTKIAKKAGECPISKNPPKGPFPTPKPKP